MKYNQPFDKPSDPNASYVNGDPSIGVQGSIPPAASIEFPQREIVALITAAGFTPDNADLQQLIRALRQDVRYCVATAIGGNPNTLSVVTTTNGKPPVTSYQPGLVLDVKIPADNTGASTITVDGLSAVSIVRANGATLGAAELPNGAVMRLIYDGTRFQLGFGFQSGSTTTNNNQIDIPYADDTSTTPSVVTAAYSPAITAQAKGDFISTKLKNTLVGPSTITVNALAPKPIVRPDSSPTQRNDAFINEMLLLAFDGTNYQIVNSVGVPPIPALTATADWYVNGSTGNDSTLDGTSATVSGSHGPFKTIQRAAFEVAKYNMNGYNQTVHITAGNYNEYVQWGATNGVGQVIIVGTGATGGTVTNVFGPTGYPAMTFNGNGTYTIDLMALSFGGLPLASGQVGDCLAVTNNANVTVNTVAFGGANRAHIACGFGGHVTLGAGTISCLGNAQYHLLVEINSSLTVYTSLPSTSWPIYSVPLSTGFSIAFLQADTVSVISWLYQAFSGFGNVVGSKYHAATNGIISVFGNGSGYVPGTVAGTTDTGGQFV
jgi:hypothetical protein